MSDSVEPQLEVFNLLESRIQHIHGQPFEGHLQFVGLLFGMLETPLYSYLKGLSYHWRIDQTTDALTRSVVSKFQLLRQCNFTERKWRYIVIGASTSKNDTRNEF